MAEKLVPAELFAALGRSWTLVESLWRHPARKGWLGGGADRPGLHSVCLDPRDPTVGTDAPSWPDPNPIGPEGRIILKIAADKVNTPRRLSGR